MTWGKALLPWVADPEAALRMTCHLNHKYALDGCDPCSYAGILWCARASLLGHNRMAVLGTFCACLGYGVHVPSLNCSLWVSFLFTKSLIVPHVYYIDASKP